ncbi:rhodanese-like domain-containing protein [Ningiella sp. W23]|uniref:rhodanese-like domain-containing protein n=1 Tax=Ningiella sp. W23 TaxID=3023715 RepID=UPI003757B76A
MKISNRLSRQTVAFVLGVFSLLITNTALANVITELGHEQFESLAEQSLIVDVRTPEEYAKGHVPGAVNIPLATVSDSLALFGNDEQQIVVYCRSGYRAGKALEKLANAGYTNLYHLEGDITGWIEADKPLEIPKS